MRKDFSGLRFLWITVLVFIADLITKDLAMFYLDPYSSVPILPFFNLTLAYNNGAAFSLLKISSIWPNILFGIVAVVVSITIFFWLCRLPKEERMTNIALTLILGGALGNLWDRLRYDHVIDFIDLYIANWHWPVFNIADAAVSIGALLLIWRWVGNKK